ncbi:MAG: chemotaxis response regulator protein-glutamate methylesterase [Anaerolineae bacterium]|nr:chemotaxis response regulator protein-glutamate methylesterase [Anaerolineae bacterium]
MKKIRVLIVDDSALVRKILSNGLGSDPEIQIVGTARDPYVAYELIQTERPDVLTLDVEMPRMDGVTFLKKYLPQFPIPAVIVSSLTERGKKITIEAMEAGAVDVVLKPKIGVTEALPEMMGDLISRVKAAARVNVKRYAASKPAALPVASGPITINSKALAETTDRVIAIGASAGGVAALARIIPMFPAAAPGIVIVQHMPAGFTTSFAGRLDSLAQMRVKEAEDGDRVRPGLVLLAPGGDRQLEVHRSGGEYRISLKLGEKVSGHCPSVDVMFQSVAKYVGKNAVAAILTGMGADGAQGLLAIRQVGGQTYAQDEATCVVFGMPQAAWKIGAADQLLPLDQIPSRLLIALRRS